MAIIDIGTSPIDREHSFSGDKTIIVTNNPANVTGQLTVVAMWVAVEMASAYVATFYRPDPVSYPNKFTARAVSANLGIVGVGYNEFPVTLNVVAGDFIGIYFTDINGGIDAIWTGGTGIWYQVGNQTACVDTTFLVEAAYAISLYGTEITIPTVTIQTPTSVLLTTATANGNITDRGWANCTKRGFEYGLTKIDTQYPHDNGDFGIGAYTKALTSLIANTTYWIRCRVENSAGIGYSEWIQFQTAASGTIPSGTNLFIAADLAGYTFQLMRSETDDGETYTGYFVISTDLTNKQSLAFYKRILDLHLYFRSESSGTATIYVKRDSEASWQTIGTVSLTGTADIVILHLAPDIRGKHFLFKISATNFFRCLGVLFEYLPESLR